MKIALAQLNYTVGDVEGNASKVIEAVEKAKQKNADLVVFALILWKNSTSEYFLWKNVQNCNKPLTKYTEWCRINMKYIFGGLK